MNDSNEPRAGFSYMVNVLMRIANGPDQGEHDSIEFLRELARSALESSTHMVTNEAKKSTDMVTSHMGFFSDEGIVK